MNIIPWQRRGTSAPAEFDLDEFWHRLWGNGEEGSHLPALFRSTRPFPAVNVAETEADYTVTLDLPGIEKEDVQIDCTGDRLLISGERKWEHEQEDKEYRRVESQFGRFERVVRLPENADGDPKKILANYKKGILTITVPKRVRTPAAKIKVTAG
jgi:HSP20 family protein